MTKITTKALELVKIVAKSQQREVELLKQDLADLKQEFLLLKNECKLLKIQCKRLKDIVQRQSHKEL